MTDMPIYHASELNPDTCLEIAMFLFETRRNSGLTITEAAVRSGLAVNDIDELDREAVGFIQEKTADVGKGLETNAQNAGRQIF